MTISPEEINNFISDPYQAIDFANLIYVSEEHLSISRKKVGRGFSYFYKGERVKDKKTLERIKRLVIPPGWKEVRITHLKNGHLQVVGRDEKNRKQYIYHPTWSKLRNETKFFKMTGFGENLPKIRKQVDKDLDLPEMSRKKVLALILRLMEETHIRIGNHYYARKNKTYGLSTFRTRHVKTYKNRIKFEFIGKKGKEHAVTVKNRKLIKLVNQCEEIPGWELFKFYDENGDKHAIDSGMINEYIHEISGDLFSAKDFRTWSATKIFFETLRELGYTEEEKQNKKNLIQAFDASAEGLGNTRAVCRSYYVHPKIVNSYETGEIVPYFDQIKAEEKQDYISLSETEKVILNMIKDYEVNI
ncbi:DNA topoisomerase I [Salegentibacter salinarum]|uniref:DNA topoisomerase n=1 Tax=Salegentibacter salinarum TaxID=447422 RepID=A0A2N0TT95_9FLAO|nr:DNA topoisomerase IB [Salegentibacter salinarum]PKD17959.1 DNA topoisomerase I [Salegentibacter salinarum]SKB99747.1 DNA topoisomerase-1 [Salegentibacter salinarum]